MRRCWILLVAVLGLLAACTGGDEPSAAGTAASTPVPSTSVDGTASSPGPSDAGSAAPSPSASSDPTADAVGPGQVLVAGDRGVDLVAADGGTRALTSLPARAAYDDGAGGVVLQGLEPPGPDPPSAAVMWLPPGGGEAVTVVGDGAADAVRLWDAGVVDGQAVAFVTMRTDADSVEDSTETVQTVALPGGETSQVTVTGGWESGADLVTYGGGRAGVHRSAEGEETFTLLDLAGEVVPAPANPLPDPQECLDPAACPIAVAVAADGGRLAWLEAVGDGARLVVQPVDAEEPEEVVELPADMVGDARLDDVRVAGNVAIVNLVTGAGDDAELLEALRIDLSSGDVERLSLVGRAAPLR